MTDVEQIDDLKKKNDSNLLFPKVSDKGRILIPSQHHQN